MNETGDGYLFGLKMEMGTTVKIKNCTLNGNRLKWYLVELIKAKEEKSVASHLLHKGSGFANSRDVVENAWGKNDKN